MKTLYLLCGLLFSGKDDPCPARSLTPFFYPRTGSKRVWRASLDRRRGIGEAGASSTFPAVGFGLTDDAASQASRCSARRLLNNLRQVSNKFLQFKPQRQLRLPQIRAGDGAPQRWPPCVAYS